MKVKAKINSLFTCLLCALIAVTAVFGNANLNSAKAEDQSTYVDYKLSEEISKMNSMHALSENVFSFYSAVYWCGPYLQWDYAELDGSADAGVASYSQIEVSSDISLTPRGANPGVNTIFSYTGNHVVGRAESGEGEGVTVDRTWAIGWTAPENGKVIIPEAQLVVTGSLNAHLSMGFSKGARAYIAPDDQTLNWVTYESGDESKSYTIAEQTFSVSKGEEVFINLYASAKDGVSDSAERYVNFSYDPIFRFEKALQQ